MRDGCPLGARGLASSTPLRMIVAHLGQPFMQETVMLMRKNPNVFADLSARFPGSGSSTTGCASRSSTA
jgi:predicted TIM-barrel fold metal-dependent hydrolase